MTDSFMSDFSATTQSLPKDRLGEAGTRAIDKLAEKGFEVRLGLTEEFTKDISEMALEPGIRLYCPKDASERFKDQASTKQWLSKKRSVFLLLKHDGSKLKLAGYGWVGGGISQYVSGGETTLAIRIGEAGQGQGLAAPFAWLMVASAAVLYGSKNMWLEAWKSNGAAVHVYHKIGFVTVAEVPSELRLLDGSVRQDVRVYMSLPNELLP